MEIKRLQNDIKKKYDCQGIKISIAALEVLVYRKKCLKEKGNKEYRR